MIQKCVEENATAVQDQTEYMDRYNGMVAKYESTLARVDELETQKNLKQSRAKSFERFIRMFSKLDSSLIEFDEDVWLQAIEVVKVKNDGAIIFTFQGGTEIEV